MRLSDTGFLKKLLYFRMVVDTGRPVILKRKVQVTIKPVGSMGTFNLLSGCLHYSQTSHAKDPGHLHARWVPASLS